MQFSINKNSWNQIIIQLFFQGTSLTYIWWFSFLKFLNCINSFLRHKVSSSRSKATGNGSEILVFKKIRKIIHLFWKIYLGICLKLLRDNINSCRASWNITVCLLGLWVEPPILANNLLWAIPQELVIPNSSNNFCRILWAIWLPKINRLWQIQISELFVEQFLEPIIEPYWKPYKKFIFSNYAQSKL